MGDCGVEEHCEIFVQDFLQHLYFMFLWESIIRSSKLIVLPIFVPSLCHISTNFVVTILETHFHVLCRVLMRLRLFGDLCSHLNVVCTFRHKMTAFLYFDG